MNPQNTMQLNRSDRTDVLLIQSCVVEEVDVDVNVNVDNDVDVNVDDADNNKTRHRFRIGEVWHRNGVILTPQSVAVWDVDSPDALTAEHFEHLAELGGEVVVLGSGIRAQFPAPALTRALMNRRIGLEIMDTRAACRTYNILASDGRNVVAALIS